MPHNVIIGGGPAATNAIETIRQLETTPSEITLISDEVAHSRTVSYTHLTLPTKA